jgi:hypothetical protein
LGGFIVIRIAALIVLLIFPFASFASITSAQDNQSPSLGEAARQARAVQSSAPKSSTVVTDDNLQKSQNQPAGGKLSADRQAFCDELRQRNDPKGDEACAALAMDMGHEYEELTDRYAALTKRVCVANKGQIPSSAPQDQELAAQWRELTIAAGKFAEMMKAEMKTLGDDDAAVQALSKEEVQEASATIPDWPNAAAVAANPKEKQAFHLIQEKYKPRMKEKEAAAAQEKTRVQRYFYDLARMQEICGHH